MNYLIGKKIKLVKFSKQHITTQYIGWLNDPEVNRFLCTGRFPVDKGSVPIRNDEKNLMFSVYSNIGFDSINKQYEDIDYNKYIGTCSLNSIDWIVRKAEIGYLLGEKSYWGCGIATEIIELLTNYSFGRINLNKITAGVVEGNFGSIKALEKNGFKQFSVLEQEYYLDGKYLNAYRFHNFKEWYNAKKS